MVKEQIIKIDTSIDLFLEKFTAIVVDHTAFANEKITNAKNTSYLIKGTDGFIRIVSDDNGKFAKPYYKEPKIKVEKNAAGDIKFTRKVVADVNGNLGYVENTGSEFTTADNYITVDLEIAHPAIKLGSGGCKMTYNKSLGIATIMLDFTSTQHINSNATLFNIPTTAPTPLLTSENDLMTLFDYYYEDGRVKLGSTIYTAAEKIKSVYILKGNKAIRGKVFPNYRYKTSFTFFINP